MIHINSTLFSWNFFDFFYYFFQSGKSIWDTQSKVDDIIIMSENVAKYNTVVLLRTMELEIEQRIITCEKFYHDT